MTTIDDNDKYRDERPVNLFGNKFYSWEAPVLYAVGIILILFGGFLCMTTPQPTSGFLSAAQNVSNVTASAVAMPMPASTVQLGSVVGHPQFESKPLGVALQLYAGSVLGLFGLIILFVGELVHTKERVARLKEHIEGLESPAREEEEEE